VVTKRVKRGFGERGYLALLAKSSVSRGDEVDSIVGDGRGVEGRGRGHLY